MKHSRCAPALLQKNLLAVVLSAPIGELSTTLCAILPVRRTAADRLDQLPRGARAKGASAEP